MAAPQRRADRPLLSAVERSLASANLLASPATLVVGVSGGPDSVCLLHLLTRIALKRSLTLVAAHLDHGLRGREGEEDAEAVSDLCRELDVPCIIGSHSVPEYRAAHLDAVSSIEAAARGSALRVLCLRGATDGRRRGCGSPYRRRPIGDSAAPSSPRRGG